MPHPHDLIFIAALDVLPAKMTRKCEEVSSIFQMTNTNENCYSFIIFALTGITCLAERTPPPSTKTVHGRVPIVYVTFSPVSVTFSLFRQRTFIKKKIQLMNIYWIFFLSPSVFSIQHNQNDALRHSLLRPTTCGRYRTNSKTRVKNCSYSACSRFERNKISRNNFSRTR